jgi:drug/metabolite transporter (DMT)-like permease
MLIVATVFWGMSFTHVKNWQDAAKECPSGELVGTLSLLAVRTLLALAIFAVVRWRQFVGPTWQEHRLGMLLGLANFVGIVLQIQGLASTTPALSGFFTSLASAWVPLILLVCFRTAVAGATLLGLALGVGGAAVLGIDLSQPLGLGKGELYTLASSVVFGGIIVFLDRLGRRVRSDMLTVGFIAFMGLPALVCAVVLAGRGAGVMVWLEWLADMLRRPAILLDVTVLAVLCTVLSFHWMTAYQPHVSAGRAALIYLLEPVFAAAYSIAWGLDAVTGRLLIGGALILGGNLLVELPLWVREWNKERLLAASPKANETL